MDYIEVPKIPVSEDDYKRVFDGNNVHWYRDGNASTAIYYNRFFLKAQQNYVNNLLTTRGHVFLNEVLATLGFDETNIGAVVGWTTNEHGGIDFGCWSDPDNNSYDKIDLTFNVQGIIVGKL